MWLCPGLLRRWSSLRRRTGDGWRRCWRRWRIFQSDGISLWRMQWCLTGPNVSSPRCRLLGIQVSILLFSGRFLLLRDHSLLQRLSRRFPPRHGNAETRLTKMPRRFVLYFKILILIIILDDILNFRPTGSSTGRGRMPTSFGAPTNRRGVCPWLRDVSKRPHILMTFLSIILDHSWKSNARRTLTLLVHCAKNKKSIQLSMPLAKFLLCVCSSLVNDWNSEVIDLSYITLVDFFFFFFWSYRTKKCLVWIAFSCLLFGLP